MSPLSGAYSREDRLSSLRTLPNSDASRSSTSKTCSTTDSMWARRWRAILGRRACYKERPPPPSWAALIHGRAAEFCEYVRGTTLEDVLYALPRSWNEGEPPVSPP